MNMSDLSVWQPETEIPAFPPAFLGYQRKAVDRYLKSLLETPADDSEVFELQAGAVRSADQLNRYQDLGREIGDLLLAVQETANQIRERAEIDAARWREEATVEVEDRVARAQSTAEELREAAWEVSTQMVGQMQAMEVEAYRKIEEHSHGVIAEAENEVHRVREEARRRADAIRSNAHMESIDLEEKTRSRCDQMIDSAEHKVAAIQERVLALERHRNQLLEEIGGIRSGVAPIGVKMIDQTGSLIYPTSPVDEDEPVHVTPRHEMSGLVKVITPPTPSEEGSPLPAANENAEAPPRPALEVELEKGEKEDRERVPEQLFEDLFSSLRKTVVPPSMPARQPLEEVAHSAGTARVDEEQLIELQEETLLPISNQFLRLFKRLLTEEQNLVLEGLRTGKLEWEAEEVDGRLRSHLEMLMEQSWQAGHRAAERLSGRDLPKPGLAIGEERGFASQLVTEVTEAMSAAGSSESAPRSRLASRTFRVWRNEKLDRCLREVSERYYQQGLSGSLRAEGAAQS